MAAIGLRCYRIRVVPKGTKQAADPSNFGTGNDLLTFLDKVLNGGLGARVKNDERQRSFQFEQHATNEYRTIHGLLSYGMYGFESKLIDVATGDKRYDRTINDLEEIPLYCQFWIPNGTQYGYVVFQSFQGRSCNTLFLNAIYESFKAEFKNFFLGYEKLMPEQVIGLHGADVFVKELRLIKKKPAQDVVDRYLDSGTAPVREIELVIRPRRNKMLGKLTGIKESLRTKKERGSPDLRRN